MVLSYSYGHEALTESAIRNAEQAMHIKFMDDYRRFLLRQNGGHPNPCIVPVHDFPLDSYVIVDWLLCIAPTSVLDIHRVHAIFAERLPKQLLAFARDPGGNLFCLASHPELIMGGVYYWDHEGERLDAGEPDLRNVYFIASSLTEFLDLLSTVGLDDTVLSAMDLSAKNFANPVVDEDMVWHHDYKIKVMQLLPFDLHASVPHHGAPL